MPHTFRLANWLCAVLIVSCEGAAPSPIEVPLKAVQSAAPERVQVCPEDKIAFTQATGCSNDGSVEFCVASGNAASRLSFSTPRLQTTRRCAFLLAQR